MEPAEVNEQVMLHARPEPIVIDLARSAIIVADMQNAFVKEGGMFDKSAWPIAGAQAVIAPCKRLLEGAREAGVRVVFLEMSYDADLANVGGPDSPNPREETGMPGGATCRPQKQRDRGRRGPLC